MTTLDQFPTPPEIRALAQDYGYEERRPEVSRTLFLVGSRPDKIDASPVLINVFYSTRGIMTRLPHPTQGYNSLWRSSAYDSLEELAMLFENPRCHTGRGYRQAKDAVRGCAACGYQKRKVEYSTNQWRAGPGKSVCVRCVTSGNIRHDDECKESGDGGVVVGEGSLEKRDGRVTTPKPKQKKGGKSPLVRKNSDDRNRVDKGNGGSNRSGNGASPSSVTEDVGGFPRLSLEALREHDKRTSSGVTACNGTLERRQFNCPLCPEEGRGRHVFFKRVPSEKPITKCPKCKRIKRGRCNRLYPIPKGEEKGYGLYRCARCDNTWGSSRAIMDIGQACHSCEISRNSENWVKPFRIEVYRPGGRPRPLGARRKPRETIDEREEVMPQYSPADQHRFNSNGGNALGGGGGGSAGGAAGAFDWVVPDSRGGRDTASIKSRPSDYKSIQHKCEGCATGACRSRKLPISGIHDVHDGDTASTSGSIVTNSEVDKSEFPDRDIDFNDWEIDDGTEVWVTVGKDGKMLRG